MAYDTTNAMVILKARMDRAGVVCPAALEIYWQTRLDAGEAELAQNGIRLRGTADDDALLADYVAWKIDNRDKAGGMPDWLKLERRERWLKERHNAD